MNNFKKQLHIHGLNPPRLQGRRTETKGVARYIK
jgi:hypothetical protein